MALIRYQVQRENDKPYIGTLRVNDRLSEKYYEIEAEGLMINTQVAMDRLNIGGANGQAIVFAVEQ